MEWAWLIPALSFVAFPIVAIFGRFTPLKGALISIAAIAAGFVLFWVVMAGRVGAGFTGSDVFRTEWFTAGPITFIWGMTIDPLTVAMLGLVTLVATIVQVYSISYMKGEPRFSWYFAAQSLFAASMLTLVLADNLLLMYVAWELVGLCSYLLIGFYFERRSAAEAAKKAFITTRIGDVGFLIGVLILWKTVGTFDIPTILQHAQWLLEGDPQTKLTTATATWSAILLFTGAMGKSAQFPLHVWLPDAMEGPSPVSALIHAATMVTAGVYLVGRMFGLFEAAPASLLIVAIIGLITMIVSGTIGLVVTDLKRIVAYSTINDLGLMMLSLGSFGLAPAIFHLLVHGFSKAMLFLGAGNVMHGTGGKTDIRKMGGLRKVMPFTAMTFAIGALSLAGLPVLAGFWSKDEIVSAVFHRAGPHDLYGWMPVFFVLLLVMVFLKAIMMARAYFVPFTGELSHENHHAHEADWLMKGGMLVLAVLAVVAGFLAIPWGGTGEGSWYPGITAFLSSGHEEFEWVATTTVLAIVSTLLVVAGLAIGWAFYYKRIWSSQALQERFAGVHTFLDNRMYMDHIYQWTIDHVVLVVAGFVRWFDRAVVNDIGVNGPADSVRLSAGRLRYHITGRVYNYALGVAVGAIGVAIAWWILAARV